MIKKSLKTIRIMSCKKYALVYLFFLIQKIVFSQTWVQISDFPSTERDDGVSFIIGNKAYCGTGVKPGFIVCKDMYSFDMQTETWDTINPLPTGLERQYATGFSHNGYGYIFGGIYGNVYFNDLWMYDPVTGHWQNKASLPSIERMGACSFVINDTAYIMGGRTSVSESIEEMWAYCMTSDTWTFKGNLPFGERWRASAVSSNGKGYLIFGKDASEINRRELYQFEPFTNSWNQLGNFPGLGRVYSSLSYMNEKLIVMAGLDSISNSYNDMWQFDLNTFEWQELASIPAAKRRGGMCFNNSTTLFYTAGIDQSNLRLKETWKVFNPTSIPENDFKKKVIVYPNPTRSEINIEFELGENIIDYISVQNARGQIVKSINEIDSNSGVFQVDLSKFVSGLYFVRLHCKNEIIIKRIIVE